MSIAIELYSTDLIIPVLIAGFFLGLAIGNLFGFKRV